MFFWQMGIFDTEFMIENQSASTGSDRVKQRAGAAKLAEGLGQNQKTQLNRTEKRLVLFDR